MRPSPSPKAAALGAVAAIAVVVSALGRGGPLALASAALLIAVLAVAHAEAARSGGELWRFRAEREAPTRSGEGEPVEVTLRISYEGTRPPSYVEAIDWPDRRLRPDDPRGVTRAWPGRPGSMAYTLRPAPGLHRIRGVTLATGDPAGLFRAERSIAVRSTIAATPMPLPSGAALRSGYWGAEEPVLSRRRGRGLEFYQLREYQPGDDIRLVHWPTTARTGRPMVREGVDTSTADIALLADLSRPSWPGTPGEAAADWIMRSALRLAGYVGRTGGRVWLYILRGNYWEEWGPLRGRDAGAVAAARLSLNGPDTAEPRMRLEASLEKLSAAAGPGARLVLLLGPAVSHRLLARSIAGLGRPGVILGVFLPTGPSPLERAVRMAEQRVYARQASAYAAAGVASSLLATPGGVAWFVERVIRSLEPGTA